MTTPPTENQKQIIQNPDDTTGLPLLHSWPSVYIFILLSFAAIVVLLTWLTEAFR